MKGKTSYIYGVKRWFTCVCLLFITLSAHATAILNWTNVYYGINGWTLAVPPLHASISNQLVTISWQTDSNYVLMSSSVLQRYSFWDPSGAVFTTNDSTLTSKMFQTTGTKRFFQLYGPRAYIPVFSFGIFFNSALEFTWAAPMIINGPVHANGPIYVGTTSSSSLTFNSTITTSSAVSKTAEGGYLLANMTGTVTYTGTPPYITNAIPLAFFSTNDPRSIVEIPPASEDPTSEMGWRRLYNQAGMVLLVSNTSVTGIIRAYQSDPNPTYITETNIVNASQFFSFLSISNAFYDQREHRTIKVTQLDFGALSSWITNFSPFLAPLSQPRPIIYIADHRTVTTTQLDAIRIVNAATLPIFPNHSIPDYYNNAFTLATPNPLYILGNYNCPTPAYLGTTNTSDSSSSALIADSLTILSSSWDDYKATNALISRNTPTATTINAAILAGMVYTTGTDSQTFSGGVHNLPRLLEPWDTSILLTINGSIVNLYPSVYATNQFQLPGNYYNAPSRRFSFDFRFQDPALQPPGTPLVSLIRPDPNGLY